MKDLRYESASLRSVGGSIIGVSQALTMTAQRREVHNMDAMAEEIAPCENRLTKWVVEHPKPQIDPRGGRTV
ncbi:hypothetical protein [Bifidobacterium apri]|uniref:hypothetical protein n=1 Tax=Bifidobacterium apri TaxID=1769423 RepID=UPI00142EAB5B|nr:hypothetical protein [Bifidobacterium apri]